MAQSTELRKQYRGKNKGEEPLERPDERTKEKQEDGRHQPDNMMAHMLKTFTDSLPMDLDAITKDNPEAREALEKMWETVQRNPVPAGDNEEEDER
jgi:hypothetical protein